MGGEGGGGSLQKGGGGWKEFYLMLKVGGGGGVQNVLRYAILPFCTPSLSVFNDQSLIFLSH